VKQNRVVFMVPEIGSYKKATRSIL